MSYPSKKAGPNFENKLGLIKFGTITALRLNKKYYILREGAYFVLSAYFALSRLVCSMAHQRAYLFGTKITMPPLKTKHGIVLSKAKQILTLND